jgi:hypothetical protein
MGFFGGLFQYLRYVFWALMPRHLRPESLLVKAQAGTDQALKQVRFRQVLRVVRWALHALVVLAILALLFWLNHFFDLARVLRSPWRPMHHVWLPFLFLLAYALWWLGRWLLKLLGQEPESADFPDIVQAWAAAQRALAAAGVEPTEAPLFLVLGRPSGSVEDLFGAARLTLQIRHVPGGPDAPLHAYASRDAIFVTCEGASLLGRLNALLAPETLSADEGADGPPRDLAAESTTAPDGEAGGGPPSSNGPANPVRAPAVAAVAGGGGSLGLEGDEAEAAAAGPLLVEEQESDQLPRASRNRLSLLRHSAEVERETARLKFLCRLIARRRRPYCPVNGILLVLPYDATDNAADAFQAGELCRQDLAAAREALRVHCPVQALVGGLEAAVGFPELVRNFDERQRRQLLGRRFPLLPRFPEGDESASAMIDDGVRWLCLEMLPALVHRQLGVEGPEGPALPEAVRANARLVQFLGEWRRRQPHLSRLLTQGLTTEPGEPALLGGCWVGAAGPDPARGQAFVHGVFRLLIEDQNNVFWTAQALNDDRHFRRLTWLAYAAAALLAAALVTFGYLVWIG